MAGSPPIAYSDRTLLALAARLERLEGLVASVGMLCRKELMQRYRIGECTLHRWIRAGKLPRPVKVRRGWRLADLEAWELSGQLPAPGGGLAIPIIHRTAGAVGSPLKPDKRLSVPNCGLVSCPAVQKVSGSEMAKRPAIA
jgi:predicted DNA-binding transcriptional regulator AlpA